MKEKYLIAIVIVGVLLLGGYLIYSPSSGATVSALGESRLTVQPDSVVIYLNAQANGATAQEAKDKQVKISDDLLIALLKLGIDKKDIQTSAYSVNPDYDWNNGRQTLKGYTATQQYTIKTKNFDKVAGIVDSSVDAGALVSWINFELSQEKQNEHKAEALKAAGEDAKVKAQATAAGLGKKIGSLVSIKTNEFNYNPYIYYSRDSMAGSSGGAEVKSAVLNIAPQDLQITASVSVEYKIRKF